MSRELDPGVLATLQVVKILEEAGIPCCLVGTSALRYYGARRVAQEWQICVPTHQWGDATTLITNNPTYKKIETDRKMPDLVQTYPRYVLAEVKAEERLLENFAFVILPAQAAHLEDQCHSSNFERSQTNLPYPKLPVYVQSVLDMQHSVDLGDVIDGMDLTEEWGQENLAMEQETDADWVQWANDRIRARSEGDNMYLFRTGGDRQKLWTRLVGGKQKRGGVKYPAEYYATRFRLHGSPDPRTRDRVHV